MFSFKSVSLIFPLVVLLYLSLIDINSNCQKPEHENCSWVTGLHVERMRDLSDCRYFFHCMNYLPPYRQKCPENVPGGYDLYFNGATGTCDHPSEVNKTHPECFATEEPTEEPEETTTTTMVYEDLPPPTTTKKPRPPGLNDDFGFEIDCSKKVCGFFPNTYGDCSTFVVCVNGEKVVKKCNGGQMFDDVTRECQPAANATCWTEPNAGPHEWEEGAYCPYHGNPPTQPQQERPNGEVILQNPVVTNWGNWEKWEECPRGMYATGLYAWRKVIRSTRRGTDHIGIYSVSLRCQTPAGNETNTDIISTAPGSPQEKWPHYYMCSRTGAIVGFQLNSVPHRGYAYGNGWDEIATDNVKGYCSCSGPVFKPYDDPIYAPQSGHRGFWTQTQYCKKHQAVCGMQTQMQFYKQAIGRYDNTGMNNMRVKCCNVEDPLKNCVPTEERMLIRECDGTGKDLGIRCDFDSRVGLTFDYEMLTEVSNFYTSVGYDLNTIKDDMQNKTISKMEEDMESGRSYEFSWDDVPGKVKQIQSVDHKTMYIQPFQKAELYQIVGRCGHFLIRTNRYVRVNKMGNMVVKTDIFEV